MSNRRCHQQTHVLGSVPQLKADGLEQSQSVGTHFKNTISYSVNGYSHSAFTEHKHKYLHSYSNLDDVICELQS